MRPLIVPFIALTLTLAGCVSLDSANVEPAATSADASFDPWSGFEDPLVVDHDHADPTLHDFVTPTVHAIAQTDFGNLAVPTPAFGEADLLGEDHLVVAALLNGFYVVDVTDREDPVAVAHHPMTGFIADVKASASGNFVFLGVQLAGFTGIHAYHVGVREAPTFAGAWPMNGGCHMLAVQEDHLYCAPNDATVRIFQYMEAGPAVAIEPVGVYDPKGVDPSPVDVDRSGSGEEFTHDMTVQADPLTGESVMFVSFWDYGVRVVDVADPANPAEVGAWTGEGAGVEYEGNIHTTMASTIDGTRVIATVPEYPLTPSVTFLDATDYGNMSVLGVWAPKPADAYGEQSRSFSTHNFQFVNGHVYMGMYHGGVQIIDVATLEKAAMPATTGYYLPTGERPVSLGSGPSTWDVLVKDGYVYATDIPTGLHVLHYVDDAKGDAAVTGFA